MSDWPPVRGILTPSVAIAPSSLCSIQTASTSVGGGAAGAATWPEAARAIYIPFRLDTAITIVKAAWSNGTGISGNVDVGVYDEGGGRLVSSGSTAHAGSSALQIIDLTDTRLSPGVYYMAMAFDNTTSTILRTAATSAELLRILGVVQQASAFPLPAIATFATVASTYLPYFVLTTRSVV